ncbi:centrosomal protein POC5 isoform X2 [Genypterus blacodes]|uniref:centrosomal protein POC5 isoform X2 n=1 Tax=Genypterus blacodes TaxID=154954 RepID=UPI003F7618E1
MSSVEGEPSSPVLPRDSDRGSSVSSELQEEYEELLRYAVVTPKLDPQTSAHLQQLSASHLPAEGRSSQRTREDARSQRPAAFATEADGGRHSRQSVRSSQASLVEPHAHSRGSHTAETADRPFSMTSVGSDAHLDRLQPAPDRSLPASPHPVESTITEMFISEESINRMENILDTWSSNLKSNVRMELRNWKMAFIDRHQLEMRKEKEKYAAQAASFRSELGSMKDLLQTYETSNQRKDEMVVNLSKVLDRQKDRLEKMRAFSHWRIQHTEVKEEAYAARIAQQHYQFQLKKKVWSGWHALIQKHWKVKVEQACRKKAEEVCVQLTAEHEAKLAEHHEEMEKAQAEIQRLRLQRERSEESMKKAFMRGVCALNMEALNMFQSTEGRSEEAADAPPPQDGPGSSSQAQLQPRPNTCSRFSPYHMDHQAPPPHSEGEETVAVTFKTLDALPPHTVAHSSLPLGGTASTHKQVAGRTVSASQPKPSKTTLTTRITARPDVGKAIHANLQTMSVAPPMSSVIVERHHPVTQLTIGQAIAAKYPRSSQQPHGSTRGKSSSKTCHSHSIKVVD